MKKQLLALLFAACTLIFGASMANAAAPLDVDCNVLGATLEAVDSGLGDAGVDFDNLGDLVSQAKKDEDLFELLRGAIFMISRDYFMNPILFTDPKEVVPTVAKCGLTPLLVRLVSD